MSGTTHRTTWRVPKLLVYRVATPSWDGGLNRYPCGVIGAYLTLGHWCVSLVWKRA